MIDLHCHLLPGIDDGPKTMEESLKMAEVAVANSINKAVVTPHIVPGKYDNTLESITTAFHGFKKTLKDNAIPLEVGMAAEVRLDHSIVEMVEQDTMPFLGDYQDEKLFLLEFPHHSIPTGSLKLIDWLRKKKIIPVIAHPERNFAVIEKPKILGPFIKKGCLIQITADSVSGKFGKKPRQAALKLLELDWVNLLASDAHNLTTRPPEIETGRKIIEDLLGAEKSWYMARDFPEQLTRQLFQE